MCGLAAGQKKTQALCAPRCSAQVRVPEHALAGCGSGPGRARVQEPAPPERGSKSERGGAAAGLLRPRSLRGATKRRRGSAEASTNLFMNRNCREAEGGGAWVYPGAKPVAAAPRGGAAARDLAGLRGARPAAPETATA